MISNMQQQNLDGVVTQILSNDGSPLYINNNNTQKNKNINTLPSSTEVMHNLSPNGLNFYKNDLEKTFDQSSENAKETVTSQASHTNVNVCLSFLDEISELIKKQPSLTESQKESAFNQSSDRNRNQISKTETISSMVAACKKPTIRDEHQENAFRRIEDVHNYSKISRSDESTNSSSQDDEEYEDDDGDDDDGNNIQQNSSDEAGGNNKFSCNDNAIGQNSQLTSQNLDMPDDEDKTMPEHHARRPMNAFLIFCKRHRAIVREKYKHLENRSITKILGDWWATLDAEEKVCYTNLAKQYKDAFFSANPNFKWYKLPAPPLRTLSTRPSNADRPISVLNYPIAANDYECSKISKDIRSNRIPISGGISYWNYLKKEPSEVGAFKLADETQMGNLSSLMIKPHDVNTNGVTCSTTSRPNVILNISDDVQYSSVGEIVTTKHDEPLENMRDHAIKMENDHLINGKRKLIDDGNPNGCYKRPMLLSDNSFSSGDEDGLNKKSARSCKGKKYQEFLNSGQITIFTKKARTKTTSTSNTFPHNNYCKPLDCSTVDNNLANSKLKIDVSASLSSNDQMKSPQAILDSPVKQFDASDFDLEEKIKALPAQSLDGYLQRKRETKKKKKINSKRYTSRTTTSTKGGPKTILEAREQIQNAMVGSQKRKARKESITRRDINAITTNDAHTGHFETVESLVQLGGAVNKIEVDDNDEPAATAAKQTNTSDLLILAEVATTHIEENV